MRMKHFLAEGYADKFGFDTADSQEDLSRSPNFDHEDGQHGGPLIGFDLEYCVDMVAQLRLGHRYPKRKFFSELQWGTAHGAVKLSFGTKYDAMIDRMVIDMQGNPCWINKKMMSVNRAFYSGKEESVAIDLRRDVEAIYNSPPDNPLPGFEKKMEGLVIRVAEECGEKANDPLYLDRIYKQSDTEFIIVFGVRGFGVQAPDQRRVEYAQAHLKYHKDRGVIQLIQSNVESPLSSHTWELMPSDFELYYAPSQSTKEIAESISTIFKYF